MAEFGIPKEAAEITIDAEGNVLVQMGKKEDHEEKTINDNKKEEYPPLLLGETATYLQSIAPIMDHEDVIDLAEILDFAKEDEEQLRLTFQYKLDNREELVTFSQQKTKTKFYRI